MKMSDFQYIFYGYSLLFASTQPLSHYTKVGSDTQVRQYFKQYVKSLAVIPSR